MARPRVIEIRISDPETVLLLERYRQFLAEEDCVEGSMGQIVEGMALAFLDDHERFGIWCKQHALAASNGETHA